MLAKIQWQEASFHRDQHAVYERPQVGEYKKRILLVGLRFWPKSLNTDESVLRNDVVGAIQFRQPCIFPGT